MDTIKQLRIKKQVEDLGDKAILAVDGDIIAYRTACVVEDHWEGAGYDIVNTTISQIMENTGVNKCVFIYLVNPMELNILLKSRTLDMI